MDIAPDFDGKKSVVRCQVGGEGIEVCFSLDLKEGREALKDLGAALAAVTKVVENFDKLPPGSVVTYTWECEASPVGYCAYDPVDDHVHDQCLFCGDPEERK